MSERDQSEWLPGYPAVRSFAELAEYEFFIAPLSPTYHRRKIEQEDERR